MSDINHQVLVEYFGSLADGHKGISGFFRMDLTEIMGSFRKGFGFPCMVLESHDGDLGESSRTATSNNRGFAFTIYENPKKDNPDDQNAKLSSCEVIGLQVIARMKHDEAQEGHFLNGKFKVASVKYAKVGPIFSEKLYGYRFEGEISGSEPLFFDPTLWSDNPVKCE